MNSRVCDVASIGTRVSYEDMANPRRSGVVCDVRRDRWGLHFDIAWDGTPGGITTSDLRQPGWRVEA